MSNAKKIKLPFKSIGIIGGMKEEHHGWTKAAWVEVNERGRKVGIQDLSPLSNLELRAAMQCYTETLMPMLEKLNEEAERRGLLPKTPTYDWEAMMQKGGDA